VVASVICLALGGVVLAASRAQTARHRAVVATLALAAFVVLALLFPLPPRGFILGDGSSVVQDRSNFDDLVRHGTAIRFSAHLAYRLLDRIDAALGSTADSPLEAYRALSWLAGFLSALSLWCLAATDRWSARSVRYIALALMAPATLFYFGYLEVGYLSLSAAAFAFVARDVMKGSEVTAGMLAGAVLFGLGAAMHGIGYLAIAALFFAIVTFDIGIRRRLVLATTLSFVALGAALIWVWYYVAVLGFDVIPGHAVGGFIARPLWQAREAEGRILYPLLSAITMRDVLLSGLVAGLPLTLVVLFERRQSPRDARLALAFAVPCLAAFVLFWPVQGIAIEMDMIVAAFPAVFALLWVCSASWRGSVTSAVLLALGHATFWWVVRDDRFINGMLR